MIQKTFQKLFNILSAFFAIFSLFQPSLFLGLLNWQNTAFFLTRGCYIGLQTGASELPRQPHVNALNSFYSFNTLSIPHSLYLRAMLVLGAVNFVTEIRGSMKEARLLRKTLLICVEYIMSRKKLVNFIDILVVRQSKIYKVIRMKADGLVMLENHLI